MFVFIFERYFGCKWIFTLIGFLILINLFIYLFLAALSLHCCTRAFSSCGERRLLFIVVCGLLTAAACLCCGERALGTQALLVVAHGLSSCCAQAQLLCDMCDFPRPGLEPTSPALAGGFLTTAPPGKSRQFFFKYIKDIPLSADFHYFC